jgi:predicted metal-dependent HD superfamily phosphohydrolase
VSLSLESWRSAWRELGGTPSDAQYRALMAAWSEPQRHYHTPQHLRECLDLFDAVRDQAHRPAEVALALWFHDAIYDARRKDNEERSAEWACQVAQAAGVARAADSIHALVMATRHDVIPQDPDARLLVDIDLAILGSSPGRFDESTQQIREEYIHLGDEEWREGRARVLQEFLARPCIFSTPGFYSAREPQARANLLRALRALHT